MEKLEDTLKWVKGKIADLEDDLQHYTMVDKDKAREFFIRCDLEKFKDIEEQLVEKQIVELATTNPIEDIINKCMFGNIKNCLTKNEEGESVIFIPQFNLEYKIKDYGKTWKVILKNNK